MSELETTGKFLRSVAGVYVGTKGEYRTIVYDRLLTLAKEAEAAPEITEATFTLVDNMICRLETQGRPSQAADCGWHEALAAVHAALAAARGKESEPC